MNPKSLAVLSMCFGFAAVAQQAPSTQPTIIVVQQPAGATTQPQVIIVTTQPAQPGSTGQQQQPAPATQPVSPVEASRDYFNQVSEIINHTLARPATSADASWYNADLKRLQELPTTGVDPGLITWSGTVAQTITQAASVIQVGQQRAQARAASVVTPGAYTGEDREERARVDQQNAQKQREQIAQEERARAAEEASRLLSTLAESRARVHAELSAKMPGF